jgi:hypothetical protein
MDQNRHALELPLRPLHKQSFFTRSGSHLQEQVEAHSVRNSWGTLGTLRVAVTYTEI